MNNKWTDDELRIAFENGCKFVNFNDLKDYLTKRRLLLKELSNTIPQPPKDRILKEGAVPRPPKSNLY